MTTVRAGALACLFVFLGIAATAGGLVPSFHPPFTRISVGSANLWLSTALVLVPAAVLFGVGYQEVLGRLLLRVHIALGALSPRDLRLGLISLGLTATASARLCNALILGGYPVTDDEWAARFGGELLARGQLVTRLPFDTSAFPTMFLFLRDGTITSMDWLGTQLAWAFAIVTHSGNWIFAVSAALPVPCIAYVLTRRLSPSWGLAGAAVFLASPMSFALSMTTHGHLHSRALLALSLALLVWAQSREGLFGWGLLGLTLGAAAISRPFESAFLTAPLILTSAWDAARRGTAKRRLALALVVGGALVVVAVFVAHSHAVTGGWLPARHSGTNAGAQNTEASYWTRFGSNGAFNLLRLAVWFAGPAGITLCAFGATSNRFTRGLGLGVLNVVVVLGLFHNDYGIDAVGPIHQSECAVPLTILAVEGLATLTRKFREWNFNALLPAIITLCWLVFGLGSFNYFHATGMSDSARIQARIYDALEQGIPPEARPAVVFAPQFGNLWLASPESAARGSWVFHWRRPLPDLSDDIMILHAGEGAKSVRAAFPTRSFFLLSPDNAPPYMRLTRLPSAPGPIEH